MPKQNCKTCGDPTYLTEIDKDGNCLDCSLDYPDEEEEDSITKTN